MYYHDQGDLIQSLLDHAPSDIFTYLNQWDASATTAEASTYHATSSTMVRVLLDPAAEALLQSYRDRDCISLGKLWRNFSRKSRFFIKCHIIRPEFRGVRGGSYQQWVSLMSVIIRQKVELGRKKRHEVGSIDEQIRQFQERRAAILTEVSKDI
ncbi:unnamed protein product [Prunus armeniaca]